MPSLEGEELSQYNKAHALCDTQRKCERFERCTYKLTEGARELCERWQEVNEPNVKPAEVHLKCPYSNMAVPISSCGKCHRKGYCQKLKDYVEGA